MCITCTSTLSFLLYSDVDKHKDTETRVMKEKLDSLQQHANILCKV